jgi:hypothetical protein
LINSFLYFSFNDFFFSSFSLAWTNPKSKERIAGQSLAENLVRSMQRRTAEQKDVTDLIIGGVEVSLWLGEQLAADLRRIFPNLNVSTVSSNKLIGVGDENASKVFFPGSDEILQRRIDSNTCVLLISQSGQTFATLHATRKMTKLAFGKVWILTGCFNSKMEQTITEAYNEQQVIYGRDRVFYNYSGHRPAEPSSLATAATWHSLTHLLIHFINVSRKLCPGGRMIHDWEIDQAARLVQYYFIKYGHKIVSNKKREKLNRVIMEKYLQYSNTPGSSKQHSRRKSMLKALSSTDLVEDFDTKELDVNDDDTTATAVIAFGGMTPGKSKQVIPQSSSRNMSRRSSSRGSVVLSTTDLTSFHPKPAISKVPQIVMNLSDGCIKDIKSLTFDYLVPNISEIVGHDSNGKTLNTPVGKTLNNNGNPTDIHGKLVKSGHQWADHINEPWHVLVAVAIYIFISVGLGVTLFCGIGDAIAVFLRLCGVPIGEGQLSFSVRHPEVFLSQHYLYSVIGFILQIVDAAWFIWLGKHFTRFTRVYHRRPLAARLGKRTIVIVDNPTVHQLTEIFVSKLFSQSYSIISVDVHGGSGLDHFGNTISSLTLHTSYSCFFLVLFLHSSSIYSSCSKRSVDCFRKT